MIQSAAAQMDQIMAALQVIRSPLIQGEYDLHRLVQDALTAQGIIPLHEYPVAPRARVDFFWEGIGVEIKRGKPAPSQLLPQLRRYAASPLIQGLILISERSVVLPGTLLGKPIRTLCLHRLWGISL